MIIALFFVCQRSSSIAEMNHQSDTVIFKTEPNPDLKDQEIISCNAQNGQTALYTVFIGENVFRSNLVIYDAFSDAKVTLTPVDGSTLADALKFYIASYEITFLDSTLIQSGAVGQLLSTVYNLNECIYNGEVSYETFVYITPKVTVNPKCLIKPTDDVKYQFIVESNILKTESIKKSDFDFANLVIKKIACTIGTAQEQENCQKTSIYISDSNFIYSSIKILIPKTITSDNIFTDDYGIEQATSQTTNYFLPFNIHITNRINVENCCKQNLVSFNALSVFIYQQSTNLCDFTGYPKQEFWITASELADNSGRKFQLQFYTEHPFNSNEYVDCDTWEISSFESKIDCQTSLRAVSEYGGNFSASISYKLYKNGVYDGAYRFDVQNVPSGEAELSLFQKQLCVKLLKNLSYARTFASVKVRVSSSFQRYQQNKIDFEIESNFIFPASNQTYCFNLNKVQEAKLNDISNQDIFGIVETVGHILQIKQLQSLIPFEEFYQGYIFLVSMLLIMTLWVVLKFKLRNKTHIAQKNIQK